MKRPATTAASSAKAPVASGGGPAGIGKPAAAAAPDKPGAPGKSDAAKPDAAKPDPAKTDWRLPPELDKRYETLGRIGAGGMGSVIKARNRLLPDQLVAIKRALPEVDAALRKELAQRIAGEAKGLARVAGHAGVARVYDLAEVGEELFLVMEMVEGVSLDRLVHKRNPLGTEAIGSLGLQSLDALAAAHGVNILHRDLKPSNLMLTPRGRAVLLDFGLAAIGVRKPGDSVTEDVGLQGSPYYVPPEVWEGRPADVRSDLYSLALTLYELATGVNPFRRRGIGLSELMQWTLSFAPPPAGEVNKRLHRGVGDVLMRGMAKDPAARPQSAREFLRDLRAALEEGGIPADELTVRPDGTGPECLHLANVIERDEEDDSATLTRSRYAGVARMQASGGGRGVLTAAMVLVAGGTSFWLGNMVGGSSRAESEQELGTLRASVDRQQVELDAERKAAKEARAAAQAAVDEAKSAADIARTAETTATSELAQVRGRAEADAKRLTDTVAELRRQEASRAAADEKAAKAENERVRAVERQRSVEADLARAADQIKLLEHRLAEAVRGTPRPPAVPLDCPATPEQAKTAREAWADPQTRPLIVENSTGMKLSLIPPGSFEMGSPDTEEGRDSDEIPHKVVISRPFYLGVNEVTNAQFRKFRPDHDSGRQQLPAGEGTRAEKTLNADDQPVVMVLAADAVAYCEWLSQQPAEKAAGRRYRLPTEAEWEYACRAGSRTRYWWGNGVDVTRINFSDRNSPAGTKEAGLDDGFAVSAPAGSLPANPWGLHEMHGNVWEWCADKYADYAKGPAPVTDPLVTEGPRNLTVLRGGSWASPTLYLRSACRNSAGAAMKSGEIGFRVVCEVAPAK